MWDREGGVKPGMVQSHLHAVLCGEMLLAQDEAACSILSDIPAPFSSAKGALGKRGGRRTQAWGLSPAHPFGDSLAEVLHPVCHVLLVVSTQLQGRPVCQDDLEGVGPVGGVGTPASPTLLATGREGEDGDEWAGRASVS